MSENQLREAYTLMKQGDKAGAIRLVQELLHQDRSNLNAWWLMSHLLEDEAKIVKSLENVLALNPEHLGARKRLSELRPEYTHLYESDDVEKVKSKTEQKNSQYWNKLHKPPAKKSDPLNVTSFGFRLAVGLALLCVFGAILLTGSLLNFFGDEAARGQTDRYLIMARMQNTPEGVTQAFNEAYYREDVDTLYAISCEAYHAHLDELVLEFDSPNPERVRVDFSETRFRLDKEYSDEQYAYVYVEGFTTVRDGGVTLRTDWNALAATYGYEYYGLNLENIDGYWKVCTPY